MITTEHLTIYRTLLTDKRRELNGSLLKQSDAIRIGGSRLADSIDHSTQALETALQARLRQNHARLLKAVEAALGRIDRGTFGQCENCNRAIPFIRLNVVPWARLCRDCKEQQAPQESRLNG